MNRTSEDIVLGFPDIQEGFGTSLTVDKGMKLMNKNNDYSIILLFVFVCFSTLWLNIKMILVLWREEKTIVNQMMKTELIINCLFSLLGTFQQSQFYRGLDSQFYCYIHLVSTYIFLTFNRLVPVTIALYR